MKILITGTAGFIGSTLALKLLERGDEPPVIRMPPEKVVIYPYTPEELEAGVVPWATSRP